MHFTQAPNVPDIVRFGLHSRVVLEKLDHVNALPSASERLDGSAYAVSVSISAINAEMFEAKDFRCGRPKWVVLLLDPAILWDLTCRFCWKNAASDDVKGHRGYLGGPYGFGRMFDDVSYRFERESHRTEAGYPAWLPTYSSAEVQVLDPIAPEYIRGAWVDDSELAEVVDDQLRLLPGDERMVELGPFTRYVVGQERWISSTDLLPTRSSA